MYVNFISIVHQKRFLNKKLFFAITHEFILRNALQKEVCFRLQQEMEGRI
jgi:hypothetical protein